MNGCKKWDYALDDGPVILHEVLIGSIKTSALLRLTPTQSDRGKANAQIKHSPSSSEVSASCYIIEDEQSAPWY